MNKEEIKCDIYKWNFNFKNFQVRDCKEVVDKGNILF